jgi:hypothetical protein
VIALAVLVAAVGVQPLWKDLVSGMTKEQVAALYPTGKVMLTPTCEAKVITRYKNGGLSLVALRLGDLMAPGKDQWNRALQCQETVKASIVAKYGDPVAHAFIKEPGLLFGKDVYSFKNDSIMVTFSVERNRPFTVVEYSAIQAPKRVDPDAANNL